ncbi:uncharacterized protein K452DRAFT_303867 [Aplosporella prunicola CBS 121167]|uniref:MULE transposase domain-containing protein n=1 Tax=Aplosporella prunicola CBS 121167 TaxID=1176127 RepID=A0A6A6AVS2_9PEZI|nr:uncharacterized protein K452DRAFT_303867 [Aplosporella prunicola CBS 121167]KAF2135065.1 hypothetical protein K452DRAFT_303867 [Aplosporella prunicola CBS 121167]
MRDRGTKARVDGTITKIRLECDRIETLSVASHPKQIRAQLYHSDPSDITLASDIKNYRYKLKLLRLGGLTPIQRMVKEFQDSYEWVYDYKLDTKDGEGPAPAHLVFWAHKRSLKLQQRWSQVIMLDCTYNSNLEGTPLLHIVGKTPSGRSFVIGYCLIAREGAAEWHIAKNVSIRIDQAWAHGAEETAEEGVDIDIARDDCKKRFFELSIARSVAEWDERWAAFQDDYAEQGALIDYVRNQWVPLKEQWCQYYISSRGFSRSYQVLF